MLGRTAVRLRYSRLAPAELGAAAPHAVQHDGDGTPRTMALLMLLGVIGAMLAGSPARGAKRKLGARTGAPQLVLASHMDVLGYG